MPYVQLVYASKALQEITEAEVLEILKISQSKNLLRRISGVLLYVNNTFVQLLEGPEAAVAEVYATIIADPRHRDVTLLEQSNTAEVSLPTWAMGYFSPSVTDQQRAANPTLLNREDFRLICEALPAPLGAPFLELLQS